MTDPCDQVSAPVPCDDTEAWDRVRAGLANRRLRRTRLRVGAAMVTVAAAAAAVLSLWVAPRFGEHSPATPVAAASAPVAESTLLLSEGSRVYVTLGARVAVIASSSDEQRLRLSSGTATFDVVPGLARRFIVEVADVEVRVRGTRFTVTAEASSEHVAPRVNVDHGAVEVLAPSEAGTYELVARLGAGAKWTSGPRAPLPLSAAPAVSATPVSAPSSALEVQVGRASVPGPSAAALFAAARESRRAGDLAGAIRGYEELLRRYPRDSRAPLASLELGRLKLEQGNNPAGAAAALERAAGGSFPLEEEALAKLVAAYEHSHNRSKCEAARARYLAQFPAGPHAGAVRAACDAR